MRFELYLELASRIHDERLLGLLRFPSDTELDATTEWSARWWTRGKTKKMSSMNRETLLGKITVDGINELSLRGQRTSINNNTLGCNLVEVRIDFFPSPASEIWAMVPKNKLKSS